MRKAATLHSPTLVTLVTLGGQATPSTGGGNYYPAGDVWMEIRFASDPGIACVKASNLGEHADGGTWNGGLTVQTSVDGGVTYITRERDDDAASTRSQNANYFPLVPRVSRD